ncbi:MAG: SpoIIE family protein phosphatase [Planctomycetota bacterium]|jgi:sigma-B regulation protein RsbU (phosphoserine phosphatase)
MTIRNKLLILLLGVSLIPLIAYFTLDISFSRHVRNRVKRTLWTAVEENAHDTLVQTIKNYEEKLKFSSQAVRFGISHYVDQVQQNLWSISVGRERSGVNRSFTRTPSEDIPAEAYEKYKFVDLQLQSKQVIDFESQLVFSSRNESQIFLPLNSTQLARTCRNIYAINPESILWIYTILADGIVGLYPSPGLWPYEPERDLRKESWYVNAEGRRQFKPIQRIEPLTGRTVMTIALPLFGQDNSFAGVVAMDIDLSGMQDRMEIPEQWQKGAWKLLIRLPLQQGTDPNEAEVVCCTTFLQSTEGPGKPSKLIDICSPEDAEHMIEDSRKGNAGFIRRPFNEVDSLWVYGSSRRWGGFPILVVPYELITEQADNAQQLLFKDNVRAIQIATFLTFIVIVAAVVLAVMRAHKLTVPITDLADAAGKLAQGDFDVRVNIATNDELQQLGDIFNQTGPKLKAMEKMKGSLELARAIQQNLLPGIAPKLEGFELAGNCKYCDETGGDYYDFIELSEVGPGIVGIALGDVTGHGIGAALLMTTARGVLRSNAQHYGADLTQLFEVLNRHIESDTDYDKFITLFYGILDANQKSLVWVSGGHDPALWYHKDNDKIEELPNTGMPVGIMENTSFEQGGPVIFKAGDVVVIGTDGIWEAQNESGVMFGKDRLRNIIIRENEKSATEICSQIIDNVTNFSSSTPQLDDITLVVIKCV